MDTDFKISAFDMHQAEYKCKCPPCFEMQHIQYNERHENGLICKREQRRQNHANEVFQILQECPGVATLVVGPKQMVLTCHKALLGFYSKFFDAALYSDFAEGTTRTILMPEANIHEMSVFISWCYTGTIDSNISGEALWILGDMLQSSRFCNHTMFFLFDVYHRSRLPAQVTKYVYRNTSSGSILRQFIKELVGNEGPFSEMDEEDLNKYNPEDFVEDWEKLIMEGGEFVLEMVRDGKCFNNNAFHTSFNPPYLKPERFNYLLMETTRPIEEFLSHRPRH